MTLGTFRNFPGEPVVQNPPCNVGHTDSIPGPGTKIPYATGQLSLGTTAAEPALWSPRVQLERALVHATPKTRHGQIHKY